MFCTRIHVGHGEELWKPLRCISYLCDLYILMFLQSNYSFSWNSPISGSTDHSNPPCRPSHPFSSERRTLWLTFHFPHTIYTLSKPSFSHHPISRFTYASNSPSWTSRAGCFIRQLINRFIRTLQSQLQYLLFLNVNVVAQKGA